MDQEQLEKLLDKCFKELEVAHQGDCSPERADRNAALFLQVQMTLADHLSNAELKAKMAKNEVERLSSEKYFEFKKAGGEKKLTEVALDHCVCMDQDVFKLKGEMVKFEADYKKWNYVIGVLSNGHIYYRNLSKRENN